MKVVRCDLRQKDKENGRKKYAGNKDTKKMIKELRAKENKKRNIEEYRKEKKDRKLDESR